MKGKGEFNVGQGRCGYRVEDESDQYDELNRSGAAKTTRGRGKRKEKKRRRMKKKINLGYEFD